MTYRTGDSPNIDDSERSNLEGRQVKLHDFPGQVFSCHYAGWEDWWIIRNKEGQDMLRASGTEIIDSGYIIPLGREIR